MLCPGLSAALDLGGWGGVRTQSSCQEGSNTEVASFGPRLYGGRVTFLNFISCLSKPNSIPSALVSGSEDAPRRELCRLDQWPSTPQGRGKQKT